MQGSSPKRSSWRNRSFHLPPSHLLPESRGCHEPCHGPAHSPFSCWKREEAGKSRASSSPASPPCLLSQQSQKDRRFVWVLPWAGNRTFIQQLLYVGHSTMKGEQNISSPLKLKGTNWSCALPLAGCVTSSKWPCLSEPHLNYPLGADPA